MLSELHEASSTEITEETLIEGSTVPVSMLVGSLPCPGLPFLLKVADFTLEITVI